MAEYKTVIIKYKDTIVKANMDYLVKQGAEIKNSIESINAITASISLDKIGKIKLDPNVEYVELDQPVEILGFPIDPIPPGLIPFVQTVPWGVQKIKADQVWPGGNKGTGIKVCIIDTGIDYNHEDLKGNYKGGYNFLNNSSNPMDDMGHGSHCAGIVAAMNNNIGVIGVAPEAYIYAVKVLDANGSGSYSNVIAGIDWAINNKMQVISMSLGGSGFSQAMKDVCDRAYNSGIVVVAAAGNSDGDGSKDTVGYPAKFDSVIAVAATDSSDKRASFSSCGPGVELSAPGVSIPSTVPTGSCKYCDPSGYKQLSGTSMACPHVAGTCALVLKSNPSMSNVEVRKRLQDTSVDLGNQGRDIFFGYGRIDASKAVSPIPIKRYRCSGAPNYECIEDPNGEYDSLEKCVAACQPTPTKRYRCSGAPNYECIEDPNGEYDSLEKCVAACKPIFQKKFNVHIIGVPTKPNGILVMKSTRGDYTADEACKLVCDTLKNM